MYGKKNFTVRKMPVRSRSCTNLNLTIRIYIFFPCGAKWNVEKKHISGVPVKEGGKPYQKNKQTNKQGKKKKKAKVWEM